jgi:hypothetical protein
MTLRSCFCLLVLFSGAAAAGRSSYVLPPPPPPVKIVFDTDICNDVDDVLALAMLHALQSRHACQLLAVTITTPDERVGPFVDAVDHFYGRPEIPIGMTRSQIPHEPGRYLALADAQDDGRPRYPHALRRSADAPAAVALLRKILSAQPDRSVVIVQVGYFSNLAALLRSPPDACSPLDGTALARRKVKLLSVMAGTFGTERRDYEFNIMQDRPAAREVAQDWPTPIVWSGKEVGLALPYPSLSIERDYGYTPHHPVAEAYCLYHPPPHNRPCWDLTSVLYAVLPDRGYFELSPPGRVTIEEDGFTRFDAAEDGRDRYLRVDPAQVPRLLEAFVQLSSQPPSSRSPVQPAIPGRRKGSREPAGSRGFNAAHSPAAGSRPGLCAFILRP